MTTTEVQLDVAGSPTIGFYGPICPICACPRPMPWLTAPDRFHGRQKRYELLRCPSCSLVWLRDPPSKLEIGNHYGPDYDRTISRSARASDHWFGRRDELLRFKSGGAVLDLGCASGGFLSSLQGPSWKLFGVEMSEEAARTARSRCGAEIFVGDILDAPFPSESFDAITCFNVFEHVYEPREVLTRVSDWLKPDGIFFTFLPNIDSSGARIFRSYWYALELPRHLYHFSPTTLRMMAQSVKLREVFLHTQRDLYLEPSVRYIFDNFLKGFGISRPPLAKATEAHLPWKVLRKIFRLTIFRLFSIAASFVGEGEMIYAVFTKDDPSNVVMDQK